MPWGLKAEDLVGVILAAIMLVSYLRVVVSVKLHAWKSERLMKEYIKRKTQND